MITLFKADDGKIFEDEDECLAYERMLEYENKDDSIVFADEKGKIFFLSDIIKNYEFAENVFYIYVKNYEGWSAGHEMFKEFGYEFPNWQDFWNESSLHCWFWDESKRLCEWVDFAEAFDEIIEKNKIFDNMIEEIT